MGCIIFSVGWDDEEEGWDDMITDIRGHELKTLLMITFLNMYATAYIL
jgi:hypothetical protein